MRLVSGKFKAIVLVAVILFIYSCARKSANNDISPAVNNDIDFFEFILRDAVDVNTVLEYSWDHTGSRATVEQTNDVINGDGDIVIKDAFDVERFNSRLLENSLDPTDLGDAGSWTITISLTDFDGDIHIQIYTF